MRRAASGRFRPTCPRQKQPSTSHGIRLDLETLDGESKGVRDSHPRLIVTVIN